MSTVEQFTRESVPLASLDRIRERIKRAERKCLRWGLPAPVLATSTARLEADPSWEGRREDAPLIDVVDVTLTAPESIGIPGWRLLARIDALPDGGHIVIRTPDAEGIALPDVEDPQACEHCRSRRHRKDTFLVLEEASGDIRQVGRNCLRDHLGYDPERMLWWTSFREDLGGLMEERAPREERLIPTGWLLLTTARVASRIGYMSRAKAEELSAERDGRHVQTTRSRVEGYWGDVEDAKASPKARARVEEFDLEFPDDDAAHRLLAETVAAVNDLDGTEGEWQTNVGVILSQSAVRPRHLGVAVSGIILGLKRVEREAQPTITSEPLGDVGQRMDLTGTVTFVRHSEGEQYGYGSNVSTLIKWRSDGSDCYWWASRFIDAEAGDTVSLRATVKRHHVDRYTKRMATQFTRGADVVVTSEEA